MEEEEEEEEAVLSSVLGIREQKIGSWLEIRTPILCLQFPFAPYSLFIFNEYIV